MAVTCISLNADEAENLANVVDARSPSCFYDCSVIFRYQYGDKSLSVIMKFHSQALVAPAMHCATWLVTDTVQLSGNNFITIRPVLCYRENNYRAPRGQ